MALEIERKFLVNKSLIFDILNPRQKIEIKQGYFLKEPNKATRIRIANDKAYLTLKSTICAMSKHEFEYEIPVNDANELISLCSALIEKTRYLVCHEGLLWEVDVFHGNNEGLIIAEVELMDKNTVLSIPYWVTTEITGQKGYYNSALADNPKAE